MPCDAAQVHAHVHIHADTDAHVHACAHTHIQTHTRAHDHGHNKAHVHTQVHAHAQARTMPICPCGSANARSSECLRYVWPCCVARVVVQDALCMAVRDGKLETFYSERMEMDTVMTMLGTVVPSAEEVTLIAVMALTLDTHFTHRRTTALPHRRTTALPRRHATALLHCCTTALLRCHAAALLHCCTAALLHDHKFVRFPLHVRHLQCHGQHRTPTCPYPTFYTPSG